MQSYVINIVQRTKHREIYVLLIIIRAVGGFRHRSRNNAKAPPTCPVDIVAGLRMPMCRERDSNPHGHHWPRDFKSLVSTNSTIAASVCVCGAENGTRTRDPDLGKVVLYQLSYFRMALRVQRYDYFP